MEFAKTQTYEKTFDLLESGNLNWNVSKEALFSADGKGTKSYGLFRTDNNQWLGSVGEKYQPFQNSSLVETIVDFTLLTTSFVLAIKAFNTSCFIPVFF